MNVLRNIIFIFLLAIGTPGWGYTDLTPPEVHARLVRADTLLLVDVRESWEYHAGHIAEPDGHLPLTPVLMPWNSSVFSAEYQRLPQDIDIIIYCRSGRRSAAAASFLQSRGYTRVFNMTGGFSSWTYERRNGGFGDHSGQWIHASDVDPVSIINTETGDTSNLVFPATALPGSDSLYVELHFASAKVPVPPDVPLSDVAGLFRVTVLDRFALSPFIGDSLLLSDSVYLSLSPRYLSGQAGAMKKKKMAVYRPGAGWQQVEFDFSKQRFNRNEMVLRRWYNVEANVSTTVNFRSQSETPQVRIFPNPFNRAVKIVASPSALISIYDIKGKLLQRLSTPRWQPDEKVGSGIYLVNIRYAGQHITKKILYLK